MQFYWLTTCFGFNWGQSYLATLATPQNWTKMLRNFSVLYNLHILASDQKSFCFFEQLLSAQLSLLLRL